MALLKFISLSVGSLLLFQGGYATEESGNTADEAQDCVTLMNKARQEVGLPDFGAASQKNLTATNKTQTLQAICEGLQPPQEEVAKAAAGTPGTVIYYEQEAQNCAEAVGKWKEGFSAFKSYTSARPPAFQTASRSVNPQLGASPYDTVDAINFTGLYSGQPNATAECAFVTCSATTDEARTTTKAVKATVCITYPPALKEGEGPWSEEQWNKILAVFAPSSSSANAAVPTLLALAAAAVGVALM